MIRQSLLLDIVLALLLGTGTVWYLGALPRGPVGVDEATYLKEALRLLRGEVLYRDVFDLTTPGWMYLMAVLFRVFGATFGTARVAAAVIQATTAVVVFATGRQVGARREIAFALAVACVLSAEVNYPMASQHWLATLLSATTVLTYLRFGHSNAGVFATGVVVGVLISVHQQRGLTIGLGAAAFLVCDALLRRRTDRPMARDFVRRVLVLAGGVLIIVGPMLGLIVWQAGFTPVWRALVTFPLLDYRQSVSCPWGFEKNPDYLPTRLLQGLPLVLLLASVRAATLWRRRSADDHLRRVLIMSVHCAASILSIWYYPDRIHIAFIVPSFAVLAGDLIEWALRARAVSPPNPITPNPLTPSPASSRAVSSLTVGYLLALVIVAPTLILARNHLHERWRRLAYPYDGPFGRIDFAKPESVELHRQLDRLLHDVPGRTLYCYQTTSYTCLFVDGRNPTRFELLVEHYNSRAQIAEVTHMLTLKDVPYVVAIPAAIHLNEPIAAFIRRNYDPIADRGVGRYIWRRKSSPDQSVG